MELHNLYYARNVVRVDEMGRACGMCGEEEKCIGCRVLWVKPEGKRPFGKVYNIKSQRNKVEEQGME